MIPFICSRALAKTSVYFVAAYGVGSVTTVVPISAKVKSIVVQLAAEAVSAVPSVEP